MPFLEKTIKQDETNMKNGFKIGLGWLAVVLLMAGCGDKIDQGKFTNEQMKTIPFPDRSNLPAPAGGISLNVESETITMKDLALSLEEKLKPIAQQGNQAVFNQAARPLFRETLRNRVTDILLYKEAKKKSPDNIDDALDKAVENEISRFLASYGNNRAVAESTLKNMGYDWKSFRDFQRRMILTQSYLAKEFTDKRPVTHSEMIDYYTQHRSQYCTEGTIQFSLIDIIADKLPSTLVDPNESAQQAAGRLAALVMDKLKKGEDFAALAEKYSQGPLASSGGLWRPITTGSGSIPAPYDSLETKALTMEPGQVAGPLTAKNHLFILKLQDKKETTCQTFDEVQNAIEQQFQFEFRKEQYMKMIDRLVSHVDTQQMEQFLNQSIADAYAIWSAK
jgi:parvulin-like peptidyl-prolyl isomerase